MDTDRLKNFCTVVELGSISKASEMLGISHSGLSKSLTTLQKEMDLQLIRPHGRGIEITPEGKTFYQKSLEIVKLVDRLGENQAEQVHQVRIGLSESLAVTCSALLAKELSCPVSIHHTDVGELEGRILNGELDFGVAFVPQPKPELEYLKLGKTNFNAYARVDLIEEHPEQIPFITPTTDITANPMGFKSRDGWPHTTMRNEFHGASNFSIAMNFLKAGQAALYMPDFAAKLENQTQPEGLPLQKLSEHKTARTEREMFLIKLKNVEESSAMKKVAKVMRKVACR